MPKKKATPKAAKKAAASATRKTASKAAPKSAATAKKKAPARKPAPPAKKAAKKAASKTPSRKPDAKKPALKAPASKKSAPKKKSPPAAAASKSQRSAPRFPIKGASSSSIGGKAPVKPAKAKPQKLTPAFLDKQKQKLIELRDHILDQMQGVAQDSLRSNGDSGGGSAFGMHQADAGSDAYEKDFALSLLSQEQDALYEVEEAIKRIESQTYGICEMSGEVIPKARLEAIPFARFTLLCQQEVERSQRGRSRWESSPQFMKSTDNFFDESDDSEDDDGPKLKD